MTDSTLYANKDERTVRGLLLPWNEKSRASNVGPVLFPRGVVSIPRDPSVVTANISHDREQPVGRATHLEDTEAGIVATFSIADTEEGDQLLADIADGKLTRLSAEVKGILRDAKDGVTALAGALFGGAFVTEGAFESASLYAELAPSELSVEERIAALKVELLALLTPPEEEAEEPLPETDTADETPVSEENTEPDEPAKEQEDAVAEAVAPNTLASGSKKEEEPGLTGVFELITQARMGSREAETMLAALADIKISGSGALPASGVLQPAWLGEVWAGLEPERRYHSLVKNGTIVALEEKGFKLSTGSELVQSWAGNKAELPTGTATTSVVSGDALQKWAFAADLAREFYDIPAGRPVIEAFIREIFRSYARVTDKYALQKIYAAAGTQVDADTYPAGYSSAIGKLIQGVDMIDDSDVAPTFAIVAPDVYTALRFTPKDQIPEFVTFGAGRQGGTADGVQIVRDKAGVLAAGEVLVGGRDFAHMNELPNSPIQIDALDLAHGGLDKAVVGYSQWMTEYADGIVLIGDAVTP